MRQSSGVAPVAQARPINRGIVLAVVAAAQFMIVLDVAIVNVAIPSIQRDLSVAQDVLQWVAIAYGLCFGGFLLLGGRAADLLGRRRMLLGGLGLFAIASLAAGLAGSIGTLIAARAAQGLGAAFVAPAALSILTSTFAEGADRNRALAVYGAVGGTAASAGVSVGGILTSGPGWEWIFFVNVPIGALLITAAIRYLPESWARERRGFDVVGAVLGTGGLLTLVYALNKSIDWGWDSGSTLGLLGLAGALLAAFVTVESRLRAPMLPLRIFRNRSLAAANGVTMLLFGAFFPTIFFSTLYMQQVLGFSSLRTGFYYLALSGSFLVTAAITGEKIVNRTGTRGPVIVGTALASGGLIWLAQAPVAGTYLADLLPGFLLIGVGLGFAVVAAQVAAFQGVVETESGLASGLVNTSQEIGGALGVAITTTVALSQTQALIASGGEQLVALTEGFQNGYLTAGFLAAAAALLGVVAFARTRRTGVAVPTEPALAGATADGVVAVIDDADDTGIRDGAA